MPNLSALNPINWGWTSHSSPSSPEGTSTTPGGLSSTPSSINLGSSPAHSGCVESIITFTGTVIGKVYDFAHWVTTPFRNAVDYITTWLQGTTATDEGDPAPTLAERLEAHLDKMAPGLQGLTTYTKIRALGMICAEMASEEGQAQEGSAAVKEAFTQAWARLSAQQQHNLKVEYCKLHGGVAHPHGTDEGRQWAEDQILEHGPNDAFDATLERHMQVYAETHFARARVALAEQPMNMLSLLAALKAAADCQSPICPLHTPAGDAAFARKVTELLAHANFPEALFDALGVDADANRTDIGNAVQAFRRTMPEYRFAKIDAKLAQGTNVEKIALFIFPNLVYHDVEGLTMDQPTAGNRFSALFERLPDEAKNAVLDAAYQQYVANNGGNDDIAVGQDRNNWFSARLNLALDNDVGPNVGVFLHGLQNHGL